MSLDSNQILEELNKLTPGITQNDDGSYSVVVVHQPAGEAGSTLFRFSEIERLKRTEFNAFVEVVVHHDKDIKRFSGRLNLASMSSREGFVRSLERITGRKKEFDSYLSQAIESVNQKINAIPRMSKLLDAPPQEKEEWLLEPFILDGAPNILFGEGGGGKTFIALRWMLSLATGIPFLGIKPLRTVSCMFLDYEDTNKQGLSRMMRLAGSKLLTPDGQSPDLDLMYKNLNYFPAMGVPIHELVPILKEKIKQENIEFILIDSAVTACNNEPEKAETVSRFFNALAQLGVTTLTIAHETKSENHEHVFGSIFWKNFTRNMWNAQSEKNPADQRQISFGLFHRKCNHTGLRGNVPLRIFHGEGYIDIVRGNNEEWGGKSLTLGERIVAILRSGPKQFGQIVETLRDEEEVKKDVVTATLTRLNKRGILAKTGKEGSYWEIAK